LTQICQRASIWPLEPLKVVDLAHGSATIRVRRGMPTASAAIVNQSEWPTSRVCHSLGTPAPWLRRCLTPQPGRFSWPRLQLETKHASHCHIMRASHGVQHARRVSDRRGPRRSPPHVRPATAIDGWHLSGYTPDRNVSARIIERSGTSGSRSGGTLCLRAGDPAASDRARCRRRISILRSSECVNGMFMRAGLDGAPDALGISSRRCGALTRRGRPG
jgi:hypothetical protein